MNGSKMSEKCRHLRAPNDSQDKTREGEQVSQKPTQFEESNLYFKFNINCSFTKTQAPLYIEIEDRSWTGKIHEKALQMKRQGTWKDIVNVAPFKSLPILEKVTFPTTSPLMFYLGSILKILQRDIN